MSMPARSPVRSSPRRKSVSLVERNTNLDNDNVTLPVTFKDKAKKRAAYSIGGEGLKGLSKGGFEIGRVGEDGLTPTKRARRSLKPRKSILKAFNSNTGADEEEDNSDLSNSQNFAHTIAFSTSSLSRRVSFAPNAHVRMFEKDREREKKNSGTDMSQPFPLPPTATAPRISITEAGPSTEPSPNKQKSASSRPSVTFGTRFMDVGGSANEISMDMESDGSSDDADGVDMSAAGRSPRPTPQAETPSEGDDEDAEGEDDMSMDETQIVYGGIVRRQSMAGPANADETFSTDGGKSTDDERTMDFTVAIGGMLPNSPPLGASQTRGSVGYSIPMSPNSAENRIHPGDPVIGEGDMSIDETVVIGGIIGADESNSTISEGDSVSEGQKTMTFTFGNVRTEPPSSPEMEMTQAIGGISAPSPRPQHLATSSTPSSSFLRPPQSPAFSASKSSGISPAAQKSYTSITQPSGEVPSFARPTVSSARKVSPYKRNVFAPSPSPYQSTTPRKGGMSTAADVAKRLSFSSTTSSAGKKRPREDGETSAPGSAKKSRPTPPQTPAEEVFGTGSTPVASTPGKNASTTPIRNPRVSVGSSLGRPSRSLLPPSPRPPTVAPPTPREYGRNVGPSPGRSLGTPSRSNKPLKSPRTLRQLRNEPVEEDEGQDDAEAIDEEDVPEWDQPPAVSLSAFLEMAGVQFNENLPSINRRKSTARKSMLAQSQSGDRDYPLHEYAEAQIHEVFYNMYRWANGSLRTDINKGHGELEDREKSCAEDTPTVIQEYLAASDEDKALFESTFKDFKLNTMLRAKENWYDWRKGMMESILPSVQEYLEDQKEDRARLEEVEKSSEGLILNLQARAKALEEELAAEKAIIAEIAECDPEELKDLHGAIDEQAEQIKDFTKDYDDAKTKLDELEGKLSQLTVKKRDCETAISIAVSKCDQYTRSDVLRLKQEYESLQRLHMWHIEITSATNLELVYDDELRLALQCHDHIPDLKTANVDLLDKPGKRGFRYPQESTDALFTLFGQAMRMLMGMEYTSLPSFVQRVGQLWTACQRLRSEIGILAMRYPTSYAMEEESVIVTATMMISPVKSKSMLNFQLEPDLLFYWPAGISNVQVTSHVVYGSADPDILSGAANETMRAATTWGYLGGFLQACVDASAQY